MFFQKAKVFPIIGFGMYVGTLFLCYVTASLIGHINPVLPIISDTGAAAPESCLFSLGTTISASIGIIVFYIRYRHVKMIQEENNLSIMIRILNFCSFCLQVFGLLSIILASNFQTDTMRAVHSTGTSVGYVCSMFYYGIQTLISFLVYPFAGRKLINFVRVFINALAVTLAVITRQYNSRAYKLFHGPVRKLWKPEDGGYDLHLIGATAEYCAAFVTASYASTFIEEFKYIEIHAPLITNKNTK